MSKESESLLVEPWPEGYFVHGTVISGREFVRDPKDGEEHGRKSYVLYLSVKGETETVSYYEEADLAAAVRARDAEGRLFVQVRKPTAYNGKVYLNGIGMARERQGRELDLSVY